MPTKLTIGELAQQSGIHLETIRYYEREGLLPAPPRTRGGHRAYDRVPASGSALSNALRNSASHWQRYGNFWSFGASRTSSALRSPSRWIQSSPRCSGRFATCRRLSGPLSGSRSPAKASATSATAPFWKASTRRCHEQRCSQLTRAKSVWCLRSEVASFTLVCFYD